MRDGTAGGSSRRLRPKKIDGVGVTNNPSINAYVANAAGLSEIAWSKVRLPLQMTCHVSHNSRNSQVRLVAPLIIRTLEPYGIEKRLGYATADIASASDTLCRAKWEFLSVRHSANCDTRHDRLHCLGLVLNIAV